MIDLTMDSIKKLIKVRNGVMVCECFLCKKKFRYFINYDKLEIAGVYVNDKVYIVCLDCVKNENDYFKLYHKIKNKLKE